MAIVKPFMCIRPKEDVVSRVAALPYDVVNRKEAKEIVEKEPFSFLSIDRAETLLDDSVDTYDASVYEKAKEVLQKNLQDGIFLEDTTECYYIYELIWKGRSQTGIVACASIDDYLEGVIKKHENTREEKEQDRIRHIDTLSAQTGPIFLAYRSEEEISNIVKKQKEKEKLYAFTAEDDVTHNVWKIEEEELVKKLYEAFQRVESIYIADGHHRAASAVKVGQKRRNQKVEFSGDEQFNHFLSVLFPSNELEILPYNRVIKDLNGETKESFLDKIGQAFKVEFLGSTPYQPKEKGMFGMYLDQNWYALTLKETPTVTDATSGLDVSILQQYILSPILGIEDPRTDKRIDFVGGIRGLSELEKRANSDMKLAFSLYPTSIQELFEVSDANLLMPPKSTWFEPKLRSGIFIHNIEG